jgi:hypothetical protein
LSAYPEISWVRFAPGPTSTAIVSRHTARFSELPELLDHEVLDAKNQRSLTSFADYAGSHRSKDAEGIRSLCAIALDFDGLYTGDLEHVTRHLNTLGLAYWLSTTYSHRDVTKLIKKDKAQGPFDCFRVVFPLSRSCTPEEWQRVYTAALPTILPPWWRERYGAFKARGLDPRSSLFTQGWYAPACQDALLDFAINEVAPGAPVDVARFLAQAPAPSITPGQGLDTIPLTTGMLYDYLERQERSAELYADENASARVQLVRHVLAGTAPREDMGGIVHSTTVSTIHSLQVTFGLIDPDSAAELWRASNEANVAAGGDYRDIAQMFQDDQFKALQHIATKAPENAPDRPEIVESTEESRLVNEACCALARDKNVFHRNGRLVAITTDAAMRQMGPQIRAIHPANLRIRLAACAKWVKITEDKEGNEVKHPIHPLPWAVDGVHNRGEWDELRPLAGLVHAPTMREDGELITEPGYDDVTQLYLTERVPLEIPAHPERADAHQAAQHLLALVQDFPFEGEHDKAVWLTLLLTRVARRACPGPSPMFCITAPTKGSGKTMLAEATCWIATGRGQGMTVFPESEDELRKALVAAALDADECIFYDNLAGKLGGAAMDAAITSGMVSGRVLGKSETMKAQLLPTWIATGNNLQISGDLGRRLRFIRLVPRSANPHLRRDFVIADFRAHVLQYRPFYLSQALTILRAFHLAGRPRLAQGLGSFGDWTALFASAVVFCGLPDPTTESARAPDEEDQPDDRQSCFETLCAKVLELQAIKPEGLYAHDLTTPDAYHSIRYAVEAVVGRGLGPNGSATATQVGYLLRAFRRKVVEINGTAYRLTARADRHRVSRWTLTPV